MPIVESARALLQFPQLAALATSPCPAWLWTPDGSRILWANAVGAAIFGVAHAVNDIGKSCFAGSDAAAAQIPRLAATLPTGGQQRLERLRGFGAGFGRALTCACSRLTMPEGTAAILIAGRELAGPTLSLSERVHRLLPDGLPALAAFAPDGTLLHANASAFTLVGGATTLSAIGLEAIGARALEDGHASGVLRLSQADFDVTMTRLGREATRALLLTLSPTQVIAAASHTSASTEVGSPPAPEVPMPAPAASVAEPTPAPPTAGHDEAASERRHPLRFVWQMDAAGRFVVGSDEFIELVGPRAIAACGRPWSEIANELKLDPDNQVGRAVATRETWSGIPVSWPVDDAAERLPVELSGLPVFDRERVFQGYRGFGVCRDVGRVNELARTRRARPIGFAPPPAAQSADDSLAPQPAVAPAVPASASQPAEAEEGAAGAASRMPQSARPVPADASASDNVVPFRGGTFVEARAPSLNPVERNAFRELAQELTARLRGSHEEPAVAGEEHHGTAQLVSGAAGIAAAAARVAADMPPIAPATAAETKCPEPAPPLSAHQILLDRVLAGVLVYRNEAPLYANRHFLELSGYSDIEALAAAGGLPALFGDPGTGALTDSGDAQKLSIVTRRGDKLPVEGRLFAVPWSGASALALVLTKAQAEERPPAVDAELEAAQNEIRDLKSAVDRTARREAQKAAAAKADFLAKVSHEIRTPLNSMIGFAEVIMAERFGSIGNERYREYLRDMHAAGTHLVSMLNDLIDLSKVETGQIELAFANVDLNDLTQQCVGIMQPQANRARIIIRTALTPGLVQVTADARSLRQIVISLLGHAIKFTGPGSQVIVSTAMADNGEVTLRVRDTGMGMRQADIEAALNPFCQSATSPSWGPEGSGLGLALTKALAEANRAHFSIKSSPNAGTLIEIAFPTSRLAVR
jgi:signal transduction histidine kinase